ncbi:MAG TPA: hypothetical protein PK671_19305, partial [Candidatus Obscuribacter sp.]|nr:hypothetical protein [Candidatus Obscuribacter sp.]
MTNSICRNHQKYKQYLSAYRLAYARAKGVRKLEIMLSFAPVIACLSLYQLGPYISGGARDFPADLLNLVAHVNSLVAYLYGYREQSEIDLPVDVDGRPTASCGGANTCAVLAGGVDALPCDDARCAIPSGERVLAYVTTRGNTTYVTYTT